jgi:hypothetical protein
MFCVYYGTEPYTGGIDTDAEGGDLGEPLDAVHACGLTDRRIAMPQASHVHRKVS